MKKKTIIIISVVSVLIIGALVFFAVRGKTEVKLKTIVAEIDTLRVGIKSKGNIQPRDQISVGTQVSGVIVKIYVDFNSPVKEGDLLAELDKSLLIEDVNKAKANVLSAKSDSLFAQKNYNRMKQLYDLKAETQVEFEEASNKLDLAKSNVANAASALHQAEVNLSYADIRSPIHGIVQSRAVDEGQTVAADFNTPTLFTIANNFRQMEVRANVDEADIGAIRLRQRVFFKVNSYPNEIFRGVVNQLRLQPTLIDGVVTYPVIIDAPNPDERLFPGMTAYITIITKEEAGIIVPLEALAFEPTPDLVSDLKVTPLKYKNSATKTVWVETKKNHIAEREVKTGNDDGVYIIIREGVKVGEKVVIAGR